MGDRLNRIFMLIFSITLHNIPEGLAVGVAFGTLRSGSCTMDGLMGAITIAVGIGLQNFPEGAAVSIPLRREGCSRRKSFFFGQASGLVEPISGVLGRCWWSRCRRSCRLRWRLPPAHDFGGGA